MKNRRKDMNRVISIAIVVLFAGAAIPALADPDGATVIKMCDTNGDNAVTQQEWEACGAPTAYPAAADKNHDGKVTADELAGTSSSSSQPPAKPAGN
jgi:hypothetical protein